MNKKLIKIIFLILFIVFIFSFCNMVIAATGSELTEKFNGVSENTTSGEDIIVKIIGAVLSAVRIVAIGVSIIMISVLGIKYMSVAPSEKANIKNQLITFTIGAAVVFGTTTILKIIMNLATNATS